MYLSRVKLDTQKRQTMLALANPCLLHGAVESSFAGDRGRNLWRVDRFGDECHLLILSPRIPDLANIERQFGYPESATSQTKCYGPLLERLQSGQIWRFRLCANPVRSSREEKDEASGRGKVFAHVTQNQQKQWLLKRAEGCGFHLEDDWFDVVHTQWNIFRKGGGTGPRVAIRAAIFEGTLTITDAALFRQTLLHGIGRAKAYGCGLLTIARVKGDFG